MTEKANRGANVTDPTAGQKEAVKTYLEQVKVITALATTLLLTPNVLLTLEKQDTARTALALNLPNWKCWLIGGNLAFLLAIILTYFVYATIAGSLDENKFNINRTATRFFSIAQFIALLAGCVALFVIFK